MVAIKYRMAGGVAGEVNRTHPASIEAVVQNVSPVLGYGLGCLVAALGAGVRQLVAGDSAITAVWGITVRPYPHQQYQDTVGWGSAAFGDFTPPGAGNVIDVIREGYVMVHSFGAPVKGAPAYVRVATGSNTLIGGFEAAADGSNTALLTNVVFNSPPDANGIAEVIIRGQ